MIPSMGYGGAERMIANMATEEDGLLAFGPIKLQVRGVLLKAEGKNLAQMAVAIARAERHYHPERIMTTLSITNLALMFLPNLWAKSWMRLAYDNLESFGNWPSPLYDGLAFAEMTCAMLFSMVGTVLFVSRLSMERFARLPLANNLIFRANTVDKENIIRLSLEEIHPFEDPFILTIGRMDKQKNQSMLIEAFKSLKGIQLMIIGSGGLERKLKAQAMGYGITLLGDQPNPYKYMARAKVFVLTSQFEGMSNVLLEALTLGVPCIATACVGNIEVLNGKGVLVPKGDVIALTKAIKEAIQ